jgi:hypothetical protein
MRFLIEYNNYTGLTGKGKYYFTDWRNGAAIFGA